MVLRKSEERLSDDHKKEPKWFTVKRTLSRLLSTHQDETDSVIKQRDEETQHKVEEICLRNNFQSSFNSSRSLSTETELINPEWLDFPFLIEKSTISLIQKLKIMFVMRGLSGSGKSTVVQKIQQVYPNSVVCSADHFFITESGFYHFDVEKLSNAHEACRDKAKKHCEMGTKTIIIDNTNIKYWEAKPYFNLASKYCYMVIVVTPKTPWRMDAEELCKRNKHNVDLVTIHRKVNMFEDFVPYYYGWFLSESLSAILMSIGMELLTECLELYPSLKLNLMSKLKASDSDGDIVKDYFTQDQNRHLLHCTSKYTGKGRQEGGKEYSKRIDVQEAYGSSFTLTLYGFTITENTLGARIHLPKEALDLFDKPEEHQRDIASVHCRSPTKSKMSSTRISQRSPESCFDVPAKKRMKTSDIPSTSAATSSTDSSAQHNSPTKTIPSITKLFPFVRPTTKGRSAHITLGTALNIPSKETTIDLLNICEIEAATPACLQDFQSVKGGKSRCYNSNCCCVYLEKPYNINVLFTGCY